MTFSFHQMDLLMDTRNLVIDWCQNCFWVPDSQVRAQEAWTSSRRMQVQRVQRTPHNAGRGSTAAPSGEPRAAHPPMFGTCFPPFP